MAIQLKKSQVKDGEGPTGEDGTFATGEPSKRTSSFNLNKEPYKADETPRSITDAPVPLVQAQSASAGSSPKAAGKHSKLPLVLIVSLVILLLASAAAWLLLRPDGGERAVAQHERPQPTAPEQEAPASVQEGTDAQPDALVATPGQAADDPSAKDASTAAEEMEAQPAAATANPSKTAGAIGGQEKTGVRGELKPQASRTEGAYRIIVGTFRSDANADAFMMKLQAEGYPAEVRPQPNGLHMVVLSRHPSGSEAATALQTFISATGQEGYISKGH